MNKPTKGNLYFFIILIFLFIGSIVVTLSVSNPIYSTPALEFGFIFIPTVILLLINRNIKENIMLNLLTLTDFFLVILIGGISIVFVLCINVASSHLFHNFVSDAVTPLSNLSLIQIMLILAVTPTICEELFFRGLLLSQYRNISIHKAAFMNGLFFGLFHLNINQFLYTFSLGVIMVYVVSITQSILSSMIMHFMLNGFSAYNLWFWAYHSPTTSEATEQAPVTIFDVLPLIVFMLILLFIITIIIKTWASSKSINFSEPVNMEKTLEDEDFRAEFNNSDETQIIDVWLILSVVFFIINVMLIYGFTGSI